MQAHPLRADAAGGGRLELAHIVRRYGAPFRASRRLSAAQLRALRAIEACRTPALGGQLQQCSHCGMQQYRYHSCLMVSVPLRGVRWSKGRQAWASRLFGSPLGLGL